MTNIDIIHFRALTICNLKTNIIIKESINSFHFIVAKVLYFILLWIRINKLSLQILIRWSHGATSHLFLLG